MKKILCAVLSFVMMMSILVVPAAAADQKFTDVPKTHWAYDAIQTMAEGRMVVGYGGGKFGPNDTITIAQMATIIGNAKGNPAKAGPDGYWAYGNIDYCINTLRCLPSQGTINATNYNKPIPREMAIYMLMNGLGAKETHKTNIEATDIPDFGYISSYARESVLSAYKNGVIIGKDDKHTFGPSDILTRAQMCMIFYRTGWTTAAPQVVDGTSKTSAEVFSAIKSMSGVTWKESKDINNDAATILTANERKYGGIEVRYDSESGYIRITMRERINSLIYDANGNQLDVAGNVISHTTSITEKYPSPSAYSYEARQLVKRILQIAYPTKSNDTYMALKDVMLGEVYETSAREPSAIRWYDGRAFKTSFNTSGYIVFVHIYEKGNRSPYDSATRDPVSTIHSGVNFRDGGAAGMGQYELNKW